jgi:hypothetical protein
MILREALVSDTLSNMRCFASVRFYRDGEGSNC